MKFNKEKYGEPKLAVGRGGNAVKRGLRRSFALGIPIRAVPSFLALSRNSHSPSPFRSSSLENRGEKQLSLTNFPRCQSGGVTSFSGSVNLPHHSISIRLEACPSPLPYSYVWSMDLLSRRLLSIAGALFALTYRIFPPFRLRNDDLEISGRIQTLMRD